jgi:hypothetical protein
MAQLRKPCSAHIPSTDTKVASAVLLSERSDSSWVCAGSPVYALVLLGCALHLTGCDRLMSRGQTQARSLGVTRRVGKEEDAIMGRGILLWLLGVPIPIILLLAMCSHH